MVSIYKGDTADNFITVDLKNETGLVISKAIFQCGEVHKEYENPVFPLCISFTREETKRLNFNSYGYLAIEDKDGNKLTADGYVNFGAKRQVVEDK